MNKTKDAILKAIVYADVFDYPLSSEELQLYLIKTPGRHSGERSDSRIKDGFWTSQNDEKDKSIGTDGKYFFLKGRKKIVDLRKKREKWSQEKLKMAEKAASWLKFIPWIKMVGVTGGLAMDNSDQNDDIDLLIVSSKNRIWLTRFLSTVFVELLSIRRRPIPRHCEERSNAAIFAFKDKICLNMYLDEDHLQVPKKEQDLFTAHEVVQVKLLWDRDGIYKKFLTENFWVKKYLPNTVSFQRPLPFRLKASERGGLMKPVAEFIFDFMENMVRNFQLWYMRSRRTTEVIADGVIRFHPQDARKWVLTRYYDSLKIALIKKE